MESQLHIHKCGENTLCTLKLVYAHRHAQLRTNMVCEHNDYGDSHSENTLQRLLRQRKMLQCTYKRAPLATAIHIVARSSLIYTHRDVEAHTHTNLGTRKYVVMKDCRCMYIFMHGDAHTYQQVQTVVHRDACTQAHRCTDKHRGVGTL